MKILRLLILFKIALFLEFGIDSADNFAKKNQSKAALSEKNQQLVAYQKEINGMVSLKQPQKTLLSAAWKTLYDIVNLKNSSSQDVVLSASEQQSLEPLFTTNYFKIMQEYLGQKNLFSFSNDTLSAIYKNYATVHLYQAVSRLSSITEFKYDNGKPEIVSHGDVRDRGIIVDIYNNSKAQFKMYQKSIDGKQSVQVGMINPGVNDVNLHLAALQAVKTKASKGLDKTVDYFELVEVGVQNPTKISLKLMQGSEFIEFLKTLPRSKHDISKNIFEMNGLPTSPDFIVNNNDWYFVLIQNPTPATESKRDPSQRIQLVNISKFTSPYLLNLQINQETFDLPSKTNSKQLTKTNIFQPSFRSVHFMANAAVPILNTPVLLLPKFMSDISEIQSLWMILTTTMLAAQTQYKLFGLNSFADAFEYFKNLNCFGNQYHQVFFIDLYNRALPGFSLYNASWLISNAVCETDLEYCSDILQIYTAQDPYGHIIVNEHQFYYTNVLIEFIPKLDTKDLKELFMKNGFNAVYTYPLNQLYSIILNVLSSEIKEGVFGEITQTELGIFELVLKNKKDKIINSQKLYLYNQPANIQITFTNVYANWIGSSLPADLLPLEIGKTKEFKVTYEFSSANNKHILLTQHASAIDKQEVFLPLQFTEYPLKDLYIDLYHTFNVKPFTRCHIIKDSVLPECLTGLTQQDWQNGIYMVPIVRNNQNLSKENPGSLTAMFYGADKKYIGEITMAGELHNHGMLSGIYEPVNSYNIYNSDTYSLMNMYLSTGVFLKNI
jgi:hypothetical protein